MARRPSRKKYAETIGEVAIGWNLLERYVNVLGFQYLGVKADVAGRIFQNIGNQTKESFICYLAKKTELDKRILNCVDHLLKATSILRENRNTVLHASPVINLFVATPRYEGRLLKVSKSGDFMHFNVSIEILEGLAKSLKIFTDYAILISACKDMDDNDGIKQGISTRESMVRALVSSQVKPSLPHKIAPLPSPEIS